MLSRRAIRITVRVAVAVVCLVGILFAGLHLSYVQRRVLTSLQSAAAQRGIAFEASSLEYNLLTFRFAASGLRVRAVDTPGRPDLLSVERVEADLQFSDLLRGIVHLRSLEIEKPQVHVIAGDPERTNLPPLSGSGGDSVEWFVDSMQISGASLIYQDLARDIELRLPLFHSTLRGERGRGRETVAFALDEPGTARYTSISLPIDTLTGEVVLTDKESNLDVREVRVTSDASRFLLSGSVRNLAQPLLDLKVSGQVDAGRVASVASVPEPVSGLLDVEATLRGSAASPEIRAGIDGKQIVLGRVGASDLRADVAYDASGNRLILRGLSLSSALATVEATADLGLDDAASESSANVTVRYVSLSRAGRVFGLPPVAGSVAGNFRASWPGLSYRMFSGNGRFRLSGLSATTSQAQVQNLQGVFDLEVRDGNVHVTTEELSNSEVKLAADLELTARNALAGTASVSVPDISTTVRGLPISGPLSAELQVSGTLNSPRVEATLQSSGLVYRDTHGVEMNATGRYAENTVTVDLAVLRWEGQSAEARGTVDLTSPSPTLDFVLDVQDAELGLLAGAFPQIEVPVAGRISASLKLNGTVEKPTAQGKIAVTGLEVQQQDVGALSADGRFDAGTLFVDDLVLNTPRGNLRASGTLDPSAESFDLTVNAADLPLRNILGAVDVPLDGTMDLNGSIRGTIKNPAGSLQVHARMLRFQDRDLGELEATVVIANRRAAVDAMMSRYSGILKANVEIDRPFTVDFQFSADGVEISELPVQLEGIRGKVTATLEGKGPLTDLRAMDLRAHVAPLDLVAWGTRVTSAAPIDARLQSGVLTIPEMTVRAFESIVKASGSFPVSDQGPAGDVTVDVEADLSDVAKFQEASAGTNLKLSNLPSMAGKIGLHLNVIGSPASIEATGSVSITDASVAADGMPVPLRRVNVQASLKDGSIAIERLEGEFGPAAVTGRGTVPLGVILPSLPFDVRSTDGPAHLTLDVRDFDVASLPGVPPELNGVIDVQVQADAPSTDPRALTASVTVPRMRLNVGNYEVRQSGVTAFDVRDGRMQIQHLELTGDETRLRASGTVSIENPMTANLLLEGEADAAVLMLFSRDVPITGRTTLRITVDGSLSEPRLEGFLELTEGTVALREPRMNVENLSVRLQLKNNSVNVARLTGSLNGGEISGSGGATLTPRGLSSIQLKLGSQGFFVEFPEGLRTVSNADLTITGNMDAVTVSGEVEMVEGAYNSAVSIESVLLENLLAGPSGPITPPDPRLDAVRLNMDVRTLVPIAIDTDFAHGKVSADLQLLGTAARPGLTGRITIEEGAELTLRERTYLVERGAVNFNNVTEIQPLLDVQVRTKVPGHDVNMQVQSDTGGRLNTTLTSDPALPEADILSLLTTGRTLSDARAAGLDVAREQVFSYLAGGLGGEFTQQAGRAIGLSQLRIEPSLIAPEAEPTARLTVGKRITSDLNFIYSMNLRDSKDQIWIGEYDLTRRFSTQALRQNDNTYRFQFQHNVRFGDARSTGSSGTTFFVGTIRDLTFTGNNHVSDRELLEVSRLRSRSAYDFFAVQRALDRLREHYASRGFLQVRVSLTRNQTASTVDLNFQVREGPQIELVYEGWNLSDAAKKRVRGRWGDVPIDSLRIQDATELIEQELADSGYFRAGVEVRIPESTENLRTVIFHVDPGIRHEGLSVSFPGAQAISPSVLRQLLKDGGLMDDIYARTAEAARFIRNHYVANGFPEAVVGEPEYELDIDSRVGNFVFSITEGRLYRFGAVQFTGNQAVSSEELRSSALVIEPGQPAEQARSERARTAIQDFYQDKGFSDSVVRYRFDADPEKAVTTVTFEIQENGRRVLDTVEISGNRKTSTGLIRSQLDLERGEIVSSRSLVRARNNLYATGAFSTVDIEVVKQEQAVSGNDVPVTLAVRVNEVSLFELRYGGFYDTERGVGGIADLVSANLLGGARTTGIRTRYDADLREVRVYASQPRLQRLPIKSMASVFFRRELQTDVITDRRGVSGNVEYRLGEHNLFDAGYRSEWVHTYEKELDPLFPYDIRLRVAPLTGSFARDTRDDLLDATRGTLFSHAVEWTPAVLGSDLRFIKYFGQYFRNIPLGRPSRVPWIGETRNRKVYTAGARVGLAHGLEGQSIVFSERFFSGGSTTVRGFEQDSLGPVGFDDRPSGGDAVFVMNHELRFPLYSFFDGVAFFDAGNVFDRVRDFSFTDLRTSAGSGLRIRTPYGVIRLDYAFNLKPRPGEGRGKFYFSIGQAF